MARPRLIEIDDSGKPKTAYFTADLADAIEHSRPSRNDTGEHTARAAAEVAQEDAAEDTAPPPDQAQPAAPSASDQEAARGRLGHS